MDLPNHLDLDMDTPESLNEIQNRLNDIRPDQDQTTHIPNPGPENVDGPYFFSAPAPDSEPEDEV